MDDVASPSSRELGAAPWWQRASRYLAKPVGRPVGRVSRLVGSKQGLHCVMLTRCSLAVLEPSGVTRRSSVLACRMRPLTLEGPTCKMV